MTPSELSSLRNAFKKAFFTTEPFSEIENAIFADIEFVSQTLYEVETGLTSKVLPLADFLYCSVEVNTRTQLDITIPFKLATSACNFPTAGNRF